MPFGRKDITITDVKIKCKRDCPDRTFDCHGKCGIYAQYRAECDKQIQKRMLESDVKSAIGDAIKRIPGKRGI